MKRKSSRGVCDVCGCPVVYPIGHEYQGGKLVTVRCGKHAISTNLHLYPAKKSDRDDTHQMEWA